MNKDYRSRIISMYNTFNGRNPEVLNTFYSADVVFEDPITRIQGLDNLKAYYKHAYENVLSIRFEFQEIMQDQNKFIGPWTMKARIKGLNGGDEYSVHGLSVLTFNEQGLIYFHRDYLDLGEMVYERLPVQGFIIRKLKSLLKG